MIVRSDCLREKNFRPVGTKGVRATAILENWSSALQSPRSSLELIHMESRSTIAAEKSQVSRHFLGLDRPVLHTVVDRLVERFLRDGVWRMDEIVLVLPTSSACRRLQELMVERAASEGAALFPPQTITIGAFPETLYTAKHSFASDMVQELAWVQALKETPPAKLRELVAAIPGEEAEASWHELARTLARLHRDLASECVEFDQVIKVLGKNHPDAPRWRVLREVQRRYLRILDGLELWDLQTARLRALEWGEAHTDRRFILVACADLNRVQRGFVQAIAGNVEHWIAGDPAEQGDAERFDALGCLRAEAWLRSELQIADGQLRVGNAPSDQADLAVACLREIGPERHVREVTLGVPDAEMVPHLKRSLKQAGLPARYGPGQRLLDTEPARLLQWIQEYLDSEHSYRAFARLVRHPAVERYLVGSDEGVSGNYLQELDAYYQEKMPRRAEVVPEEGEGIERVFNAVVRAVDRWLAPLMDGRRQIGEWIEPVMGALEAVYGREVLDLSEPGDAACYAAVTAMVEVLEQFRSVPPQLMPAVTAGQAVQWVLSELESQMVPEPDNPQAIEMVGWLELALDDNPAAIVVGLHDGVVPQSINADPFLPNSLRTRLGMEDNDRRLARDLYLMNILLRTRDDLRLVAGRVNSNGDPLVASRVLLAAPLEQLPARVLHLVSPDFLDREPADIAARAPREEPLTYTVPRPVAGQPPLEFLRVTSFRDYIACPYRFYLKYVHRLQSVSDAEVELDALQFGNMVHYALEGLTGEYAQCDDAEALAEHLIRRLYDYVRSEFGDALSVAMDLQVLQAEQRLRWFADLQAQRAREGWRVEYIESGVSRDEALWIDPAKHQLRLIGRIDRIDYHPERDEWAIWDYKTSAAGDGPRRKHIKGGQWIDLQLPLYRWIARNLEIPEERIVQLGYINLANSREKTGFVDGEFQPEELSAADAVALEIAEQIAAGAFWPDETDGPAEVQYDDFARICKVGVRAVPAVPPRPSPRRIRESELGRPSKKAVEGARQRLNTNPQSHFPKLPPLSIEASAGTGKTFQLSNRLLHILLSGQSVDGILATTFTRKAAGEIAARVLERLALACIDESEREELANHIQGVDCSAENCLATLKRLACSLHRLRIATLDAYFGQLGRVLQMELGLPPGWEVLDPSQEPEAKMSAVREFINQTGHAELRELLNQLHKGETRTRISEELLQIVDNGQELFRLADESAWGKLRVPKDVSERDFSAALEVLENADLNHKSIAAAQAKLVELLRRGDWRAAAGHALVQKAAEAEPVYYKKAIPPDLHDALRTIRRRIEAQLLLQLQLQIKAAHEFLTGFERVYRQATRSDRRLTFQDVTHELAGWSRRVLADASGDGDGNRALAQLEHRMDCGTDHLLLDEFQDTSPMQWQVLQPIARQIATDPQRKSFFCVGDKKQAIYGWRGGVAEIFDAANRTVHCDRLPLHKSWRSSQVITDAVNQVFQNLHLHRNFSGCEQQVAAWSGEFPRHKSAWPKLPGYVQLATAQEFESEDGEDLKSKWAVLQTAADRVAELAEQSGATIGVLLRTNDQVDEMLAALSERGIHASREGGTPLSDSEPVQWIQSLLHVADHPGDTNCWFHLQHAPWFQFLPPAARKSPQGLARWLRRQAYRQGFLAAVESLVDLVQPTVSAWDQQRLEQLCQLALRYQPYFSGRLSDFETWIDQQDVALPVEARVKVMTIHKSKGLQFDAVFLPLMESGFRRSSTGFIPRFRDVCEPPEGVIPYVNKEMQHLLPKIWQDAIANMAQREVIESLCVWYVAMTRARQGLYIVVPPAGKSPGANFGSALQSVLAADADCTSPGKVLYESGDRRWFAGLANKPRDMAADASQEEAGQTPPEASGPSRLLRNDPLDAPRHSSHFATPTGIARDGKMRVPAQTAWQRATSTEAARGAALHALLAEVEWVEDFAPGEVQMHAALARRLDSHRLAMVVPETVFNQFEGVLENPAIRSVLSQERYRGWAAELQVDRIEVRSEWPLVWRDGPQMFTGTVDRMVIGFAGGVPVCAEIIDFKTDAAEAQDAERWLQERTREHRPQLDAYARGAAQTLRIPEHRIARSIAFLAAGRVVEL
ncbi:MAG: hypothetical protein D6753_07750 [Planctomycetota bacterium]|nr:MAG: hypothetical protein D6753_07750 [Planctomycetota bacterium]